MGLVRRVLYCALYAFGKVNEAELDLISPVLAQAAHLIDALMHHKQRTPDERPVSAHSSETHEEEMTAVSSGCAYTGIGDHCVHAQGLLVSSSR
jgi:hypothetical protein